MANGIHFFGRRTVLAGVFACMGLADHALALDYPSGIALDAAGNVYVVVDSGSVEHGNNGDISIFSVTVKSSGVTAKSMGTTTTNISHPYSVAVSPFGTIDAGNLGTNTITVYGTNLAQTGTISDGSIVTYAESIFVDGDGDLWALDAGGNAHVYLHKLTKVGELSVDGIATTFTQWGSNFAIWDRNSTGIYTMAANTGEAVHGAGTFNGNYPNGSLVPTGVAQDSLHQQYVTNRSAGTITVFNAAFSKVLTTFAGYGTAIAIDPVRQLIYTTIPSNNEVFVYSLKSPYKFPGSF
jgi:hypothetical protein